MFQSKDNQFLLLRKGSWKLNRDDVYRTHILVAKLLAELVKSSLGPDGMDKMLVDERGVVTITNDGAIILENINFKHPVAKIIVDSAKAIRKEFGDGSISVVVLTAELLRKAEGLLTKKFHPRIIVNGFSKGLEFCLKTLSDIAIPIDPEDRLTLKKIVESAISGKIISYEKEFLSNQIVDIALKLKRKGILDIEDNIHFAKRLGGSVAETKLIDGIVIEEKLIPHPNMPKRIEGATIATVLEALELKGTAFNVRVGVDIERPDEMKDVEKKHVKILRGKINRLVELGVKVLISQRRIEQKALDYLAKHGITALEMVHYQDLVKVAKAVGSRVVSTVDDLMPQDLGYAQIFEERKIGRSKKIFIEGCKNPHSLTILIRGGTKEAMYEAERCIRNALSVLKAVFLKPKIIAGGGSVEMALSARLKHYAALYEGKEQIVLMAFAAALEVIPLTLAENVGLNPLDTLVMLRNYHEKGNIWIGIDGLNRRIADTFKETYIYEPLAIKEQILKSASETASLILCIDNVLGSAPAKDKQKTPSWVETRKA